MKTLEEIIEFFIDNNILTSDEIDTAITNIEENEATLDDKFNYMLLKAFNIANNLVRENEKVDDNELKNMAIIQAMCLPMYLITSPQDAVEITEYSMKSFEKSGSRGIASVNQYHEKIVLCLRELIR